MSRRISIKRTVQPSQLKIPEKSVVSPQAQETVPIQTIAESDTYFDKLLKNIPADIIAAWIVVSNLIRSDESVNPLFFWIIFGVFIVLTFFWTKQQTDYKGLPSVWTQVVVATIAFVVWVFALGGPFESLDFYKPLYGTVFLVIYTLAAPLINPRNA